MSGQAGEAPALAGAIFLDKDGTLLENVPYNVDPAHMRLAPGVADGLALLGRLGLPLVVVSNQPGLGLGYFDTAALTGMWRHLQHLMTQAGAPAAGFYYCPHPPVDGLPACPCRKPRPGLLDQAALELAIDCRTAWMIGDILDDVEAGRRAGCHTVLVDNGGETQWRLGDHRRPHHVVTSFDDAARIVVQHQAGTTRGAETIA